MRVFTTVLMIGLIACGTLWAAEAKDEKVAQPDVSGWDDLFVPDLSNADKPDDIWTISNGELTASEDQAIWTKRSYENFILDLEFKMEPAANSGVIIYASDTKNWIPGSPEIQILDDGADKWKDCAPNWRCGGIFGHLAPSNQAGKKPGEWNRMTITCKGPQVDVVLNGEHVVSANLKEFTSNKTNPDGSEIPSWLSTPLADIPYKGKIGLQGKHAGASIWFRNIKIKEMK